MKTSLRSPLSFLTTIFLLTAAFLIAVPTAQAGPWTKSTGEYYAKLGEGFYSANAFRTASGELITGTDYFSATTYLYAEYGLLDGLHLQTYIPFLAAQNQFSNQTYSDRGLGDASFALQASPLKLALPTAFRLEAKIPMYSGDRSPNTPGGVPGRGDAQVDFTAWLSAGGGFSSIPLYLYADVGYQYRSQLTFSDTPRGPFSDGAVYIAQIGYTFFDRATLAITSSGLLALKEDNISKSYITVGPSLFVPITDLIALEADAYITPYSRNSADGWNAGLGISFRN